MSLLFKHNDSFISLLLAVLHDFGQLLIHDGHMDYCLGAGTSNCGQLGSDLAIPTPKFGHSMLVTLNIAALDSILIVLSLIMKKMDGVHDRLEGVPSDSSNWSSGTSLKGSRYPHHYVEGFSNVLLSLDFFAGFLMCSILHINLHILYIIQDKIC